MKVSVTNVSNYRSCHIEQLNTYTSVEVSAYKNHWHHTCPRWLTTTHFQLSSEPHKVYNSRRFCLLPCPVKSTQVHCVSHHSSHTGCGWQAVIHRSTVESAVAQNWSTHLQRAHCLSLKCLIAYFTQLISFLMNVSAQCCSIWESTKWIEHTTKWSTVINDNCHRSVELSSAFCLTFYVAQLCLHFHWVNSASMRIPILWLVFFTFMIFYCNDPWGCVVFCSIGWLQKSSCIAVPLRLHYQFVIWPDLAIRLLLWLMNAGANCGCYCEPYNASGCFSYQITLK